MGGGSGKYTSGAQVVEGGSSAETEYMSELVYGD